MNQNEGSAQGKPSEQPAKSPGKRQSPLFGGGSIFTVLENSSFGAFWKAMVPIRCNSIRVEEFQMPRIVVVGGESTGKSSLLENITKCAVFPRDKDICTRMPIRLQLTNATDASDTAVEVQFGSQPATRLQDSSQVLGAVEGAMDKLPKDSICETEFVVRIRETGIPTFEFIDLPGIRAYPLDMAQKTESLVRKYLKVPNTLVIAVVRATDTRITNDRGYALVQEMGLESKTVMALTRTDRVSAAEFQEMVLDRIMMSSSEFPKPLFACIAIVNRTSDDSVTLAEHQAMEAEWFEKHVGVWYSERPWEQLVEMASRMTLFNLIKRVDVLYSQYISAVWKPRALELIKSKKEETKAELRQLGPDPATLLESDILRKLEADLSVKVEGGLIEEPGIPAAPSAQLPAAGEVHSDRVVNAQEWWRQMRFPEAKQVPWLKWVRQQLAWTQDTLKKLKTKEVKPFLTELKAAVSEAFASDASFYKKARFHQLRDRAIAVLEIRYERLMEACMEDLDKLAAASSASLCNPPQMRDRLVNGQNFIYPEMQLQHARVSPPPPLDAIMVFILAQVVYACLDALPNVAASPTAHPVECDATGGKRKSIQLEMKRLQEAEVVIQGLQ
ncbi:P-loop containing nucleoside triphosphate hydrolase protein [Dunaliella salina]|uniref:P-loop containing nucleoside triphosphate hydrolase protein n=1 Tax=Dunaliella salina TaxID=3046 RepID=A0ABQ7GK02_DUNSA|nr:P-loop containing nucleoside triphosphate hydrolase protein [Dunaliella salina]|eukprot:KAF5834941.1 P-loop containing nucleoside triphosphate hydrolase protein [Dunaliella salina]